MCFRMRNDCTVILVEGGGDEGQREDEFVRNSKIIEIGRNKAKQYVRFVPLNGIIIDCMFSVTIGIFLNWRPIWPVFSTHSLHFR